MIMGLMLLMLVNVLGQIYDKRFELKTNTVKLNRLANREGTNEVSLLLLKPKQFKFFRLLNVYDSNEVN